LTIQVEFSAAFQRTLEQRTRTLLRKCDPVQVGDLQSAADKLGKNKLEEAVKDHPLYKLASVVRSREVADCMQTMAPNIQQAVQDVARLAGESRNSADAASKALNQGVQHFNLLQNWALPPGSFQ
jgi:hypothetical protein